LKIGKMIETPARIEPCSFDEDIPRVLADLASEIQRESALLGRDLHPDAAAELADFVRVMNCYYSNLIEGHDTRPRDIERALAGAELDEERRPLALEARAHVLVQRTIDQTFTAGSLPSPTSVEFVTWIHNQFYENMPPEFRAARGKDGQPLPIEPGSFRSKPEEDVAVGRHVPPSSDRVADFMGYFEQRFRAEHAGASTRILAIAVAHHRLNYIHPFLDGNGRVSRLMSHAMGMKAGIGGKGLWSISRGLARGLKERGEYKRMMDHADSPRRGDLDGRGNLSRAALKDYCEWFLAGMLDQIRFTRAVFKLETLDERYRKLLADLGHDKRTADLVGAVLKFGQIDRGDASIVLKTSERTARNVVSKLVAGGFLKSSTPKGPLRIAVPLDHRDRLFPSLFADAAIEAPDSPTVSFVR
jgi:Fic family protein